MFRERKSTLVRLLTLLAAASSVSACAREEPKTVAPEDRKARVAPEHPGRLRQQSKRDEVMRGRITFAFEADAFIEAAEVAVYSDDGSVVFEQQSSPQRFVKAGEPFSWCWDAQQPPAMFEVRVDLGAGLFAEYVGMPWDLGVPTVLPEFPAGSATLDATAEAVLADLVAVTQNRALDVRRVRMRTGARLDPKLHVIARIDAGDLAARRARAIAEYLAPRISFPTVVGSTTEGEALAITLTVMPNPRWRDFTVLDVPPAEIPADPPVLPQSWLDESAQREQVRRREAEATFRAGCPNALVDAAPR